MRLTLMTTPLRICLTLVVVASSYRSSLAQDGEHRRNDLLASCIADTVLTAEARHAFVSDGSIKYRIFRGGIPFTNQAKENMETVVLFSKTGTRSIVASARGGHREQIIVRRFFDVFELRDGHWTAIDAEGGPGTADATAEFIQKLVKDVPLSKTKLQKIPQTRCLVEE